jgi:hypothetical protein
MRFIGSPRFYLGSLLNGGSLSDGDMTARSSWRKMLGNLTSRNKTRDRNAGRSGNLRLELIQPSPFFYSSRLQSPFASSPALSLLSQQNSDRPCPRCYPGRREGSGNQFSFVPLAKSRSDSGLSVWGFPTQPYQPVPRDTEIPGDAWHPLSFYAPADAAA